MSESRSGQRRKVEEARQIVRHALGDAVREDLPRNDAKYVPADKSEPLPVKSQVIPVLLISEAATLLGISTDELERMVEAGEVKTLTAGWAVVVPESEVEKLRQHH